MKFLLLAAGTAMVAAKCANDCSNHGNCNAKNQCQCHRNFFGADCSSRLCPAGRAFIDSAVGDVNGDNTVGVDLVFAEGKAATPVSEMFSYKYGAGRDSHDVTMSWDEAHFYKECSNKGICDATTGECACFPGYEGAGCARKSCENDCSGHGACKNYAGTSYNMWDSDATLYCECDAGYTGPGCEKRVCPSGVDPVQASNIDPSRMYRIAFRTLSLGDGDFTEAAFYEVPYGPVTWSIRLTDEYGDEWTTSLLTTNYDVVVDSSDDPLYSMPIIAGASMDAASAWVDSDSTYTVEGSAPIPSMWNSFGDGNYHVAAQVKDALEALPDGAAGSVVVHEVYASPAVADASAYLLSQTFPAPFTGRANADYHIEWPTMCGATDIYISGADANSQTAVVGVSEDNIAGCGVAIVDFVIGAACTTREGNTDVNDAIQGTGTYSTATVADQLSDEDLYVIYDVSGTAAPAFSGTYTALSKDADSTTVGGGFPFFDETTIYYQWPHFSNSDGPGERFPLFEDLEQACEDDDGYYSADTTYFNNVFAFDQTDVAGSSTAGLSLFVYFSEPTIETAPEVDYTFNNNAAHAFLTDVLFAPDDGANGETVEGVSGGSGDYTSHSLVRVDDFTGARSWDVAYHGRRAYFLDDESDTSMDINTHICGKRGICDYTTGLCDCFSGFTGDNCAIQNALAY